jgi:hypothetical protein
MLTVPNRLRDCRSQSRVLFGRVLELSMTSFLADNGPTVIAIRNTEETGHLINDRSRPKER